MTALKRFLRQNLPIGQMGPRLRERKPHSQQPNLDDLMKAGSVASDVIVATAATYARDYLAKSEFSQAPKAVVYPITIDSMDEYNHANFDGMKRFGTLTFERKGADVVMIDNKLSFKP